MPEAPAPVRKAPRWRAWSNVLARLTRCRAGRRRAGERPAGPGLRVAIATSDGRTLNATYQAASTFVLYERTAAAFEYVGLLGCAFADPYGRVESARRLQALNGLDLVFVLDEGPGVPAADEARGPQIVRCSAARPIQELVRELESRSLAAVTR